MTMTFDMGLVFGQNHSLFNVFRLQFLFGEPQASMDGPFSIFKYSMKALINPHQPSNDCQIPIKDTINIPSIAMWQSYTIINARCLELGTALFSGKQKHHRFDGLPSGELTQQWKITILNGKIHYKWPFSIAKCQFTRGYHHFFP